MKCPHCSKDIDESLFHSPLIYCTYCGSNLKVSDTEGATEVVFCPHCGEELPSKVNFCPYCGVELTTPTTIRYDKQKVTKPIEHRAKPIIASPPEQKRKADKLYKEWMKYANLPPEAIPSTGAPKDMPIKRAKGAQRLPVLYILLGFFVVILSIGVALFAMQSC